jgi:type IV secretory pathway VirB6-like protein
MQKPGPMAIIDIFAYCLNLFDMAIISIGLFAINGWAYLAYGMCALLGPILIPLLLTKHFSGRFFRWVDASFKYAMLTPVCSAFTFVWSAMFMKFFSNAVRGDYSLGHLLGLTAFMLTMVGSFAYMAFKLPAFAGELFGGGGEGFSGVANDMANFTRSIVKTRG